MTNAAAFALGALTGPGPSFDGIKGEWQLAHREKEIYAVLTACRRSLSSSQNARQKLGDFKQAFDRILVRIMSPEVGGLVRRL
jgi:hypothetical protein